MESRYTCCHPAERSAFDIGPGALARAAEWKDSMADHILKKIDADAAALREHLMTMARQVGTQLADAMTLVEKCYLERGLAVDKLEDGINDWQTQLDRECTHFIVLHQPSASDLRTVVAVSRVAADLEAVGNAACRLARAGERIHKVSRKQVPASEGLTALHGKVSAVLQQATAAFQAGDVGAVGPVFQALTAVNEQRDALAGQLRNLIADTPDRLDAALAALDAAKALSDAAQWAARIALHVVFMVKGVDLRHASQEQIDAVLGVPA